MKKILATALILALTGILGVYAQNRIYTPELIAPDNMAFAQSPDVVLDWTAVTGGNTGIITYELYLDTDPEFPAPVTFTTEFVSGYQMSELTFGQTYFWKVRAKDGDQVSDWSETRSFTVLRRMVITKPTEANDDQKPTLDLEWTGVTGIIEYDYQFDTLGPWEQLMVPAKATLNDAAAADETHGWIVGPGGLILFYDGMELTEQASGTSDDLLGVFFLDASNGWAVGEGGTILYYNGTEWSAMENSSTADLNDVFFLDASNGWAVGNGGTILHYDGTAWMEDAFSASKDLYAVAFVDASHGWAVGKAGEAVIYDGTGWSTIESNTPRDLYCVAFYDANRGYAGGKSGIFLQFQDGAWDVYGNSITNKDINDMVISGDHGWAVGKTGTVLEFDGFEWFLSSAGTQTNLLGVGFTNNNGFIVGESDFAAMFSDQAFTSPMANAIYHVDGELTETTVHDLLFGTKYYWRMRTKHAQDISQWSGARSFETLYSVSLDKPNNNSTDQDLNVELKWTKVVDGITYEIEIDDNMNFSSPIPLETEETAINAELLTFGVGYYWRVRAIHAHDASDWPEPFMFTTACCVTLNTPSNNATEVKQTPILTWESLGGITGYQVQLNDTENFSEAMVDVLVEDGGTNSLAVPMFLEKNTQYYWRARAFKSIDSSDWSDVWTFTTVSETGIGEPGEIPGLSVFPNPASDKLFIQLDERTGEPVNLSISDLLGKPVFEGSYGFIGLDRAQSIDVSGFAKGIYLIRLNSGDKVMTRKLIITR
jgi:photosystem II stability/assembly factor-like uncharacterized protein